MSTAIAPHMRLDPAFAAQLLAVARRNLLAAQHDALKADTPGEARRLNAHTDHLRNRVSALHVHARASRLRAHFLVIHP